MATAIQVRPAPCEMTFSRPTDDTLLIRLRGSWKMQDGIPSVGDVRTQVQTGPQVRRMSRALAKFSREVAAAFKAIVPKEQKRTQSR